MFNVLTEFKEFFEKNTPEAALGGAIVADLSGYFSGALDAHTATLAALTALVAFGFAEAGKDGREQQAVTAPAATPATNPVPVVDAAKNP
jgi:hypothetical protein